MIGCCERRLRKRRNVREWNIIRKKNQEHRKREERIRRLAERRQVEEAASLIRVIRSPTRNGEGNESTAKVDEGDATHRPPEAYPGDQFANHDGENDTSNARTCSDDTQSDRSLGRELHADGRENGNIGASKAQSHTNTLGQQHLIV